MDLEDGAFQDQLYIGEEVFERIFDMLTEVEDGHEAVLQRSRNSNRCFGSGLFRQHTGHVFSVSQCIFGAWSGLQVSTGYASFRFTGLTPSSFIKPIERAEMALAKVEH